MRPVRQRGKFKRHHKAHHPLLRQNNHASIEAKKNVLISAHGNSLRACVKYIENLSDDAVVHLEIATGEPLVYEWHRGKFVKIRQKDMTQYTELTLVAIQAALRAGEFLTKRFGTLLDITSKEGAHNFVTDVDVTVENMVIDAILTRFPGHAILSEESGPKEGTEALWIIDPLDGTLNFIRSVPLFAISIAASQGGQIVSGVVYLPMTRELFFATRGQGAFLNGQKIAVSKIDTLERAILVTGTPYHTHEQRWRSVDQFANMMRLGCPVRDLGAAAIDLAYVAAGRFDGYWMPTVQPWDLAAAKLLIEEAGGAFSDYHGKPYKELVESPIVASNGLLQDLILKQLANGS